jgi:formate C-acetyltransferase
MASDTRISAGLSPRLERLRSWVMSRRGSFPEHVHPFACAVALFRALAPGKSRVQVRADFLREQVEQAPIAIERDWRLAGQHLPMAHAGLRLPDPTVPEQRKALMELGLSEEDVDRIRETLTAWRAPVGYAVGTESPEFAAGRGYWGSEDTGTVYWAMGWIENHSIRDYAKVLRLGFNGIRAEIEQAWTAADRAEPGYPMAENFWRAALAVCDAGATLGRRYADAARRLAATAPDPEEKARLDAIAGCCDRVPAQGARTFAEAVQSLWLAHILTCGEDGINANSLGRLDQILYPYYAADRAAGCLDRAAALEIMEELACRLYLEYDVQAITLGGTTREGADAVNEVSFLILEATRTLGFIRDISIRWHRDTPMPFLELAVDLIARGGGIPFVFNDECFIPALTDRGIALEDARDYAPIGCVELTIPGRANPHAVSGWFNSTKCLELAMFDGCDPATGRPIGPRTGSFESFPDFESFYAAYARQVEALARNMVYHCNRGELAQREGGPLPCWSVLTDDCIRRGRDITDGGALYNYHSICFMGAANTADSLIALKQVIFDEPRVPRAELLDALRANFRGYEPLRQMLLTRVPKYGNDRPEVDDLARRVCEDFISLMDRMASPLGGRYVVHLFSFLCNLQFGKTLGATPDGRLAKEPLAYSLSANQGRDLNGVTAMLQSLARLPHRRAAGASAAIVEIIPSLVAGPNGVKTLLQLTLTALRQGVGQLQWNVTSVERLRLAQRDPEHYGNIAVRIAGYSQMFKLVQPELQEHIIRRTKHGR